MEVYTVDKKFVLKAHEEACSDWKRQIEDKFPKVFGRITEKAYTWYRDTRPSNNRLILTGDNGKISDAVGLGSNDMWYLNPEIEEDFKNSHLIEELNLYSVFNVIGLQWCKTYAKFKEVKELMNNMKNASSRFYLGDQGEIEFLFKGDDEPRIIFSYDEGFISPPRSMSKEEVFEEFNVVVK